MSRVSDWLDDLDEAGRNAAAEEDAYRRDFARRVAELAEARAVAFRRANLVRAISDAVALAEDEQAAVAHGLAVLRTRLGWSSDSEARAEILASFAPVCEAIHAARISSAPHAEVLAGGESRSTQDDASFEAGLRPAPQDEDGGGALDPATALAAFESWYHRTKGSTFWILFENVMPETPLVDW